MDGTYPINIISSNDKSQNLIRHHFKAEVLKLLRFESRGMCGVRRGKAAEAQNWKWVAVID